MPSSQAPPRSALRRLSALGALGSRLGLGYAFAKLRGLFVAPRAPQALLDAYHDESAKRVLATMGQLKGAIMKLGQIASYVSTDLPEEYRAFLLARCRPRRRRSTSRRSASSSSASSAQPVEERFRALDPVPLAAASIGQVHRGGAPRRPRGRGEGAVPRHRRGDPLRSGERGLALRRGRRAVPEPRPGPGRRGAARAHRSRSSTTRTRRATSARSRSSGPTTR